MPRSVPPLPDMRLRFPADQIRSIAGRYVYGRDEHSVLELRTAVQRAGCLDRDQLKQVALWKSPRRAALIDNNEAAFVREITGFALTAKTEKARIEALTLIDGVRWPMASVVLHFFHADPYPIVDVRALWSVGLERPSEYTFGFWWRYVEFCRAIARGNDVAMRTLDRALWQYSKESQRYEGGVDRPDDAPPPTLLAGGADQIRAFVFEQMVLPKLETGLQEVAVRAGDVHRALRLHNQMPNVCSAIESRKFKDAFELELVRREGPHRGSNAVYYFRRRPASTMMPRLATAPLLAERRSSERARIAPLTPSANAAAGTVYWVSCVSQKRSSHAAARDLYVSDWFVKARRYVESTGAPWFILSAKYGLVAPDQVIEPYELTLNTLPVTDRRRWAARVHEQLGALAERPRKVVMLAGARYREFVEPYLKSGGIELEVPMEGLRIGEQLSWLGRARPSGSRREDLRRFYALLDRLEQMLGGKKNLADCDGRMLWPRRGVYFFFERGEPRSETGSGLRVVRVGTHALTTGSSSTLWGRLAQHRGTGTGGGNHRGSIFRLIVGAAMKRQDSREDPRSWGIGSDAAQAAECSGIAADVLKSEEAWLEEAVSRFIGDLPFLYLTIDDEPGSESLRGFIERNAIALLSNFDRDPLDAPSASWLGQHSDREKVRRSGLWNNNHVNEEYDEEFLDVLERLIEQQASGSSR